MLLDNSGRPVVERWRPEQTMQTKRQESLSYSPVATKFRQTTGRIPDNQDSEIPSNLHSADDHTIYCPINQQNRKKQKPSHAYSTMPWGTALSNLPTPAVLPCSWATSTLPFPFVSGKSKIKTTLTSSKSSTSMKVAKNLSKHNKKKLGSSGKSKSISFRSIVRFASSSVGKNITSYDRQKEPKPRKRPPGTGRRRRSPIKWPPCPKPTILVEGAHITRKNIKPSSQVCLRNSFHVAATRGAIKRPVIHVEFDNPKSFKECVSCSSRDFLFVYVGLFHVFLLQFIMVVLLFFANEKEVKLSEFTTFF